MIVIHVDIHVKAEQRQAFIEAALANARQSILEPGVIRFDIIQREEDPDRFMLVEVYRDEAAIEAHKQSGHYLAWREQVTDMMAEPRTHARYRALFPPEERW